MISKILYISLILFLFTFTVLAKININTATKDELTTLKGIGEVKAEAIIKYREYYGGIRSIEELININGIGEKTIENIKNDIIIK
jgi:competence protein ComEA